MIFEATPLAGAYVVVPEPISDDRGFFARLFCATTFAKHGLNPHLDQVSLSQNVHAATIRGMHLQRPPAGECKLVRVTAGSIYDVILDVRAGSATFGQWFATVLSAGNRAMLYIPEGFAHGFQTLVAGSEVTYHISQGYAPEHAAGIAYNDPDLHIDWPLPPPVVISERDAAWPRLRDFEPVSLS